VKGARDVNAMDQALKELERGREELRRELAPSKWPSI